MKSCIAYCSLTLSPIYSCNSFLVTSSIQSNFSIVIMMIMYRNFIAVNVYVFFCKKHLRGQGLLYYENFAQCFSSYFIQPIGVRFTDVWFFSEC